QGADLVDKPQLECLFAGVDAAAGQLVDWLLQLLAAVGDDVVLEDTVNLIHEGLHFLAFGGAEYLLRGKETGVFAALVGLEGDSHLVTDDVGGNLAGDHADGAGNGIVVGEDGVGAHGDVVAAAASDVAHRHDQGLAVLDAFAGVKNDVAGDRGAAGRIDPEHD